MPRPRKPASSPSVSHAVESLVHSIRGLIESVGTAAAGAVQVAQDARAVKAAVVGPKKRGPGKGNPKLKAALKAYWAKMKGKARKSRIAKMLAGRGIKAKGSTKRAVAAKSSARRGPKAKASPNGKPGGAWASMTPEQRAERIAKMRAGRGLKSTGTTTKSAS